MSRPGVDTPCARRTVTRLGVVRNTEAYKNSYHFRVAWPLSAGERRPRPRKRDGDSTRRTWYRPGRAGVRIGKWENNEGASRRLSTRRDVGGNIPRRVAPTVGPKNRGICLTRKEKSWMRNR